MMVLKSIAVSCRLKIRGLSGIGGIRRNGTNAFALIKISYLMIKVRLESLLNKVDTTNRCEALKDVMS